MNFWTGLILGIIIGWLVEWIIDWLFWRRDAADASDLMLAAEDSAARGDQDAEWQNRLAAAEQEYEARLAAVEEEWQARLNLNEQQWQAQFAALEDGGDATPRRSPEGAVLAAGVVAAAVAHEVDDGSAAALLPAADEFELTGDREMAAALDEFAAVAVAGAVVADTVTDAAADVAAEPEIDWLAADAGDSDLLALEGMDADMLARLRLAGVHSVTDLSAADPVALAVELGVEQDVADEWIARARTESGSITRELDVFDTRELTPILPATLGAALVAEAAREAERPAELRDDLTRIRGIGPKYAALLSEAGIHSFDDLAAADAAHLREIVKPGPMQQINFESWKAQAAAFAATRADRAGDDLTILEGIGPVYATRLRENGITTFADLAAAEEATLAGVINAPAWRRINYADWIAQARLAAAGDETGLREMQARLFQREGDNLNLIRGLGERSSAALRAAGIVTFADLAAAEPERVEAIVRGAGGRGGDYAAWIEEAQLRAGGKRVPSASRRPKAVYVVPCPQDLSAVYGVGSVFEERLYAAGIGSYWELAELPDDELETILDARVTGGVDVAAIRAAAMRLAVETDSLGRAWDGTPPDDFEVLGGIGEIYERRLYEAGICTFAALAATPAERLAEICRAPAARIPDYTAWIARARELAAGAGSD